MLGGKEGREGSEGWSSRKNQIPRKDLSTELVWRKKDQQKKDGTALVGKLITDRNLNRNITCQMIRKGWNIEKNSDLEITEAERNAFIFEFRRKEDCQRILKGRPWAIQGILLNVQPWDEFTTYKEMSFHLCPFWIQFHEIPAEGLYEENAITLGSTIGEVVMVESPRRNGMIIRSFLRARVVVDIRKPLVTGMWSSRPGKEPIWIKARYERLQNFCYKCGRIGHDQRNCLQEEEEKEASYGGWLSIQTARRIDNIITQCRTGWEEEVEDRDQGRKEETEQEKIQERNKEIGESNKKIIEKEIREGEERRSEKGGVWRRKAESNGSNDIIEAKGARRENKEKEDREKEEGREEKIELTEEKEDLSKALVVYGERSPLAEVLKGIQRINLKREREEEEEGSANKRRRLISPVMEGVLEPLSKLERRNTVRKYTSMKRVRGTNESRKKNSIRKGARGSGKGSAGDARGKENQLESKEEAGNSIEKEAERADGWPITAIEGQ